MYINRIELKRAARAAMREASPSPVLATVVYCLLSLGTSAVLYLLAASFGYDLRQMGDLSPLEFAARLGGFGGAVLIFVYMLNLLIGVILDFGYQAIYAPGLARREPNANIGSFFRGFARPLPILLAVLLMGIFLFLWSCLLLIPGLIAAYRYRLTFYLLAENPDLGALEAIAESGRLMRGFKWKAFLLDLSFLGWILLGIPTFGLLYLWLMPYQAVTDANFYFAVRAIRQAKADGPDEFPL